MALHGFIALGAITEIDGKIKSSGKTTLVTHLVAAILDGRPFLGQPTMRTNIVYLTEQTAATYREALGRAGLLARGRSCGWYSEAMWRVGRGRSSSPR